jgi:hypothetical protein
MPEETELIELNLTSEEIAVIAIAAHEKDMKLNEYVVDVLKAYIDTQMEDDEFEDDDYED